MAGREAMVGKGFVQDSFALAKTEGPSVAHDGGHVGEGLRLAPRAAVNVTIVVPPEVGQFEFACFVVGHYEGGMKGTLIVASSGDATSRPAAPSTGAPVKSVGPTPSATPHPMGSMGDDDGEGH